MNEQETMTLDEAIIHARKVSKDNIEKAKEFCKPQDYMFGVCEKCSKEHEQLAEWLEELKKYRSLGTVEELREANEKQIPKKAEMLDKICDEVRNCPSCGNITGYHGKEFYCKKCGQNLDWGEGDD